MKRVRCAEDSANLLWEECPPDAEGDDASVWEFVQGLAEEGLVRSHLRQGPQTLPGVVCGILGRLLQQQPGKNGRLKKEGPDRSTGCTSSDRRSE